MSLQVDLSNKVALITGAGRGMGRAFALSFAERGANVVINDIEEEELNSVAESIKEKGGKVLACLADIARKDQVDGMVDLSVKERAIRRALKATPCPKCGSTFTDREELVRPGLGVTQRVRVMFGTRGQTALRAHV